MSSRKLLSSQSSTLLINEIIVYITAGLIFLSVAFCLFTFLFRLKIRKLIPPNVPNTATAANKNEEVKAVSSTKKGKSHKKSKNIDPSFTGDSNSAEVSESSSLLSSEADLSDSKSDDKTCDSALKSTFVSVLNEGVTLKMHREKGLILIRMSLSGTELKWKTKKLFARKTHSLSLNDILFIESGKQTSMLRKPAAELVSSDICFSLITSGSTFDFEASSKIERDVLVQGFAMIVAEAKEYSSYVHPH